MPRRQASREKRYARGKHDERYDGRDVRQSGGDAYAHVGWPQSGSARQLRIPSERTSQYLLSLELCPNGRGRVFDGGTIGHLDICLTDTAEDCAHLACSRSGVGTDRLQSQGRQTRSRSRARAGRLERLIGSGGDGCRTVREDPCREPQEKQARERPRGLPLTGRRS